MFKRCKITGAWYFVWFGKEHKLTKGRKPTFRRKK